MNFLISRNIIASLFIGFISTASFAGMLRCDDLFGGNQDLELSSHLIPLEDLDQKQILSKYKNYLKQIELLDKKIEKLSRGFSDHLKKLNQGIQKSVSSKSHAEELSRLFSDRSNLQKQRTQLEKRTLEFIAEQLELFGFQVQINDGPSQDQREVFKQLLNLIDHQQIFRNEQDGSDFSSSFQAAQEIFLLYQKDHRDDSLGLLKSQLHMMMLPHIEILEFPDSKIASSVAKKLGLKIVINPFVDQLLGDHALGSFMDLMDLSRIHLNTKSLLKYPWKQVGSRLALNHEIGHAFAAQQRRIGIGTDLDVQIVSLDDTPLIPGYNHLMSLEELERWLVDLNYLSSEFIQSRGYFLSKDEIIFFKGIRLSQMFSLALDSLRTVQDSLQRSQNYSISNVAQHFYTISIEYNIHGHLRRLEVILMGSPASTSAEQLKILQDYLIRVENKVSLLKAKCKKNVAPFTKMNRWERFKVGMSALKKLILHREDIH